MFDVAATIEQSGHLVSVEHLKVVKNALGENINVYAQGEVDVPCWVQSVTAAEVTDYASKGIKVSHKVFFSQNLLWREGDRLNFLARQLVVKNVKNIGELNDLFVVYVNEFN